MSDANPRPLGRMANRILIGCLLLALAATVLLMLQNSDAFPLGMVAVALFGILLAGLPAVQFLFYSWRQPPPDVSRGMRTAIYFSSATLVLVGAWLALSGTGEDGAVGLVVLGVAVAAVGIGTIVRAVRFMPAATGGGTQLAYGRSSIVGGFLFLLVAVMLPKFGCSCGNRNTAYRAMLRGDLRFLALAEEAFLADHRRYGAGAELDSVFQATSLDSIVIMATDSSAWHAIGTHPYLVGEECGIWVGIRPPGGMHGATEGEPKCWKVP